MAEFDCIDLHRRTKGSSVVSPSCGCTSCLFRCIIVSSIEVSEIPVDSGTVSTQMNEGFSSAQVFL